MKRRHFNTVGLSLRAKLVLSLCSIGVVLLVTAVITIIEYRRMSDYVTQEIGKDIRCICLSDELATAADRYNHQILATVGAADSLTAVTNFDRKAAAGVCEDVFDRLCTEEQLPVMATLSLAFHSYIDATAGLETIVRSDFIDSREWFFNSLQPSYNEFTEVLSEYNGQIQEHLMVQAGGFDKGYYRSIIPGIVSVAAGLLLIALLMFFLIVNYVNPLYRMLDNIEDFNKTGKKYNYSFDGDDQLQKLNSQISEIIEENIELRRRLKHLKENRTPEQ